MLNKERQPEEGEKSLLEKGFFSLLRTSSLFSLKLLIGFQVGEECFFFIQNNEF